MAVIWRKNFDIKRVDYNLPYESLIGFETMVSKTIGENPITEAVWVFRNGDCEGCYIPKQELRRVVDLTIEKILRKSNAIDRVHKKATKLNWQLFREAEKVRKINFSRLTSGQILAIHRRLYRIIHTSHMWAIATTWFLDSDGEDFSKYLVDFLKQRAGELGLNLDLATAFSVLTTPKEKSFLQKEEEESLRLLDKFQKNRRLRHWFISHTTQELVKTLPQIPSAYRRKILNHFQKWLWLPYTYIGPAYELDYFLEVWRGLLHEDINPSAKLRALESKRQAVQRERRKLIKKFRFSPYEKHLFDIAADIVWLKGFRKDTLFYAIYSLDLLLAEVARRAGLSLLQAKYLVPGNPMAKSFDENRGEISATLAGKDFSDITTKRIKFSIMYAKLGKIRVLTGEPARKFLKSLRLEKIKIAKTDQVIGTCACPGKAKGVARIVNVVEDIPKMKKGDIMLAHTTFPALVPAMRKASAIVTEDGGITCHAAIVARELQTPCVVGAKNVLGVLKDGDRVEVDANKGVVRKI